MKYYFVIMQKYWGIYIPDQSKINNEEIGTLVNSTSSLFVA